jgi:hypothetical protein
MYRLIFALSVFCFFTDGHSIPLNPMGRELEIVLRGDHSKTWSQGQESARDDVLHVPLPTRSEIDGILSSMNSRKTEISRLNRILKGAEVGKVIRFTGVPKVRSEKDLDTLEEWKKFRVFNPIGKETGFHEWDRIILRGLPSAPRLETQGGKITLLKQLKDRGEDAIFSSALVSASLITPAKSAIYYERNGVILGIPPENILCASPSDLMTPIAEEFLSHKGYVELLRQDSQNCFYRAIETLNRPNDIERNDLFHYNEIAFQPYDSETQTSISINGFYVIEDERDPQKWSNDSLLYFEAAKKQDLPLLRLSKQRK